MAIVLTDPKPLPKDGRCPRCHAKPDRRLEGAGFGPIEDRPVLCGQCGHEFKGDA